MVLAAKFKKHLLDATACQEHGESRKLSGWYESRGAFSTGPAHCLKYRHRSSLWLSPGVTGSLLENAGSLERNNTFKSFYFFLASLKLWGILFIQLPKSAKALSRIGGDEGKLCSPQETGWWILEGPVMGPAGSQKGVGSRPGSPSYLERGVH